MTQRESAQDFDPKHRIIGAVVIVVLAVVFIPMILSERKPPAPSDESVPPAGMAAAPDKVAVTTLTPSTAAQSSSEERAEPDKIAPALHTGRHELAPSNTRPTETKTAMAAPKPQTTRHDEPKPLKSGWVVQVGTFSNAANATRLERKLRAKGESLLVEKIRLDGARAVRLRVGPFRDRAAAQRVLARIRREVGVQGVVLAYP